MFSFFKIFAKAKPSPPVRNYVSPVMARPVKPLTSVSGAASVSRGMLTKYHLPRRYNQRKSSIDLLEMSELGYSPSEMLKILVDTHPDVSKAVSDHIDLAETPLTFNAFDEFGNESKANQQWLKKHLQNLQNGNKAKSGYLFDTSVETLSRQLHRLAAVHGALSAEIVIDATGNPLYYLVRDPNNVTFEFDSYGDSIPYWNNGTKKIELNNGRFFYRAFDKRVDDEYGVSPILPTLSIVFSQLSVFVDLASILKKVGFPRPDIEVLEDVIVDNAPADVANDMNKLQQYVENRLNDIKTSYQKLQPEDGFAHLNSVKVTMLESKNGTQAFDVRSLMEVIDQQVSASLKTLPSLMGRSAGRTSTFADAEIKIYLAKLDAGNKIQSSFLSTLFTKSLHLSGRKGFISANYSAAELRSKTELEQWRSVQKKNECIDVLLGVQTIEEMIDNIRKVPGQSPIHTKAELEEIRGWVEIVAGMNVQQVERSTTKNADEKQKT